MINLSEESRLKGFPQRNPASGQSRRSWFLSISAWIVSLSLVGFMAGCSSAGDKTKGAADKHPVPVKVTAALVSTVPIEIKTIGSVEAISTVNIKPQVDGEVQQVHFQEGQAVQTGDMLFTIEPRPLKTNLLQAKALLNRDSSQVRQVGANIDKDKALVQLAQANLERDISQLQFAQNQEKRYASLLKKEYVSHEQYEQLSTNRQAGEATVLADKAAVDNAQATLNSDVQNLESAKSLVNADRATYENTHIRLQYGFIHSPITGATGKLQIHKGDIVQANVTPLVVVNQIAPIYVSFAIPEKQLADIKKYQAAGALKVVANLPNHPESKTEGRLTFIDNMVDPTTGTIHLKGTFNNENKTLWPGQFVEVRLILAHESHVVVIPSQALQSGQQGDYVFVNQQGKAEFRKVVLDRIVEDQAVIKSGLKPGESVITDGLLQLAPGTQLKIQKGN